MFTETSLTASEKLLVADAEILFSKNRIIKKVSTLFANLLEAYTDKAQGKLAEELTMVAPKISKGEQYLGLPYVMLDFPRNFTRQNTFAIRTFFWWGNFFSIHLQLSGGFQNQHAPAIITAITEGKFDGWFIGVHENEWHHHFQHNNYREILNGEINIGLLQLPFIKLAKKIPLNEWDHAMEHLIISFDKLVSLTGT